MWQVDGTEPVVIKRDTSFGSLVPKEAAGRVTAYSNQREFNDDGFR
jgi:hypothetical protein